MDKHDYISKAQDLLIDRDTYKPISGDPAARLKNKLVKNLSNIKTQGGLNDYNYKRPYPTSVVPPKSYWLPKIHKLGNPLRPIISKKGAVTYGMAKDLVSII